MPVNTNGSNLRVTTNVQGQQLDNDEYQEAKAHWEHHHHPDQPWQQGYQKEDEQKLQDLLLPKSQPVQEDASLTAAHKNDLKIRNLNQ